MAKKEIPSQQDSFSGWYTALIQKTGLADYAPVKGCMVIKPYGYALWEAVQRQFDKQIKARGVRNAYFPLLIPYSFIKKEAGHIEGFSPQLAVVTHGGGKELDEPLVVRPTSETIIYSMFSRWIQSYRDLPLKINQWCNIVRWEMRTYLFLRTLEFLWQEGHTAHATKKEARETMLWALEEYRKLYEDFLAMPVVTGKKTKRETFPGGLETWAVEALLPSGKALQVATSHLLGQNFAKPFNIQYQDRQGRLQFVWQTSWGFSTRSLGGLIIAHGDDNGLKLPPKVAPVQAVILPISEEEDVMAFARKVAEDLRQEGIRAELDLRFSQSPGWRFNHWELKGAPLRIEVGKKEVAGGEVTIARRDTGEKQRERYPCVRVVKGLLAEIQKNLYRLAREKRDRNTVQVDSYSALREAIAQGKFVKAPWCGKERCEEKIQQETKATARVILADSEEGRCPVCNAPAKHLVLFSKGY